MHGRVGSVHPDITGATEAFLPDFDSWPASELTGHFVGVVRNQSGGIDVPTLCEISNPEERGYPFAQCASRWLNCGETGHSMPSWL